jgi:predicted RNA binding protein YcfA (HicA-like mRNA interferase family)
VATLGRRGRGVAFVVKVRDAIRVVEADGWRLDRQRGSHRIFRHAIKAGTVTVAGHPGDDVPTGTLASIRRQAGLGSEDMR